MRVVIACALSLTLGACSPRGDAWAEDALGKAGARALKDEASQWIAEHPRAAEETGDHACPSPRAVLDYYPTTGIMDHSGVSAKIAGAKMVHALSDVRCLVLVSHSASGGGRRRQLNEEMMLFKDGRRG